MGKTKEAALEQQETASPTFDELAAQAQAAFTYAENGDSVYSALLAIQLRLKAPKNMVNDFAHFNYRTAGQILEAVKPILAETGCTLTLDDKIELVGDRYYVHATATLHHIKTGEEVSNNGWAREALNEKGKMEPQMTGGASTFAKKYALGNLFAIDDSADDPDATCGYEQIQMPVANQDRISGAVKAFATAASIDECKTIQSYYTDVMSDPQVKASAIEAKKRLTN